MKIIKKIINGEVVYINAETNEPVEVEDDATAQADDIVKNTENDEIKAELERVKKEHDLSAEELNTIKAELEREKVEKATKAQELKESKIKAEFIAQNGNINAYETFKRAYGDIIKEEDIASQIKQIKQDAGVLFNNSPNHTNQVESKDEKDIYDEYNGGVY